MIFNDQDTILFTGDSITDCGRARPIGAGEGLGGGYVRFVHCLVTVHFPQADYRILNTGIGGNRITDLDSRWQTDVLDVNPHWLSVFIGINDCFQLMTRPDQADQVTPGIYHDTYVRLIEKTKDRLKGLILATPYVLETERQDPVRARMDEYGLTVKELAKKYNAVLVDVQQAFDGFMQKKPDYALAEDRVHPNPTGHFIIARAFLNSFGFKWQ